jgi:hypothetical protein
LGPAGTKWLLFYELILRKRIISRQTRLALPQPTASNMRLGVNNIATVYERRMPAHDRFGLCENRRERIGAIKTQSDFHAIEAPPLQI